MAAQQLVRSAGRSPTDRLASASEQLEEVLETVDFADEPALAETVLDAVKAADRAYQLSTGRQFGE